MLTCQENGRFKINQKICFNISAYHNETWQASTSSHIFIICWVLVEAMVQMIQVMLEDTNENGISFIRSSADTIRDLAKKVLILCGVERSP